MQMLRSLVFIVIMYVWLAVIGIGYAPWAIASPRGARAGIDAYCRHTLWMLDRIVGLRTEVRGTVPTGAVLVASKHQSFLDILLIWHAVPRGFFIMKAMLRFAPVLGQYGLRAGCIPVHRGKRAEAIRRMLTEVRAGERTGGQMLIYPQGTRVAPGVQAPYKAGTYALYEQLGQPCVPVATNVGLFWPKRALLRRPGLGVVEFLEPIPPGLSRRAFMTTLETRIEAASNRLMAEAGFPVATASHPTGDPVDAVVESVARGTPRG